MFVFNVCLTKVGKKEKSCWCFFFKYRPTTLLLYYPIHMNRTECNASEHCQAYGRFEFSTMYVYRMTANVIIRDYDTEFWKYQPEPPNGRELILMAITKPRIMLCLSHISIRHTKVLVKQKIA